MDVFNPSLGAGIYVRPEDTWGQGKILSFWKYGGKTTSSAGSSSIKHGTYGDMYNNGTWNEMRTDAKDDAWANYGDQFVPPLEVNIDAGCYVGFEYWDRIAKPGARTEIPQLVIGMHTGDWHMPFHSYKKWMEKNFTHRQEPEWLKKAFSVSFRIQPDCTTKTTNTPLG